MYDRHKSLVLFIIIVLIAIMLNSQVAPPNKTDSSGIRVGKWLLYLDSGFNLVETADSASYYKLINYVSGKPIGYVNYYYISGKLYFQTPVTSIDPDLYSDGEIKYFSETGDLIMIQNFQNGLLNGQADYFYPDGKPQAHGIYTDNKKTGVWKQWDIDGKYGIGNYLNDVPNGKWTYYYTDGAIRSEGKLKNGIQNGIWTEYTESGNIEEGNYLNGFRDGTWISNYSNNKPCFYGSYIAGKKNGLWKEWNQQGLLKQGDYVNDIKEGIWSYFDASGNKTDEGSFVNDKQEGVWNKYDNIGNVIDTTFYIKGIKTEIPVNE